MMEKKGAILIRAVIRAGAQSFMSSVPTKPAGSWRRPTTSRSEVAAARSVPHYAAPWAKYQLKASEIYPEGLSA
jgi:hypothetical protein